MKVRNFLLGLFFVLFLVSCQNKGPENIIYGKDQCDFCQMTISDDKFASEFITEKGKVYKFDDLHCLETYRKMENKQNEKGQTYVSDFTTGKLIPLDKAILLEGGKIESPMGGNVAAFPDKETAKQYAKKLDAQEKK